MSLHKDSDCRDFKTNYKNYLKTEQCKQIWKKSNPIKS